MILLIVDDEISIREGLKDTVDWGSIGITTVLTARNGLEAKQIVQNTVPDILLTDIRMPGMDGLELSEYVLRLHPSVKVFLLSGYTDFSYAKQAISIGVEEYFVKPVNIDSMLSRISEAVRELRSLHAVSAAQPQDVTGPDTQALLKAIQSPDVPPADLKETVRAAGFQWRNPYLLAMVCTFFSRTDSGSVPAPLPRADMELCLSGSCPAEHLCLCERPSRMVCFLNLKDEQDLSSVIDRISGELLACGRHHDLAVSASFSLLHPSWSFRDALAEAEETDRYHFFVGSGTILTTQQIRHQRFEQPVDPSTIREKLDETIRAVDIDACLELMKPLFESYRLAGTGDIETIKEDCLRLAAHLTESVHNGSSQAGLLQLGYEQFAKTFTTVEEYIRQVQEYYCSIFDILKHTLPARNNPVVTRTKEYIDANYGQSLSVDRIAKAVDRNPNYLCHLFSSTEGMSITEYINKTRVGRAKELLRNTYLMTYEIAAETGFSDYRYFSQIFKKYTGMTPSAYRNQPRSK